jgi:hypothetical protein
MFAENRIPNKEEKRKACLNDSFEEIVKWSIARLRQSRCVTCPADEKVEHHKSTELILASKCATFATRKLRKCILSDSTE